MCFLVMLLLKKGLKNFNPVTNRFFGSMIMHFVEDQPFFQKNSLQGENITKEDNFFGNFTPSSGIYTCNEF